jgi:hypothetical protein
MSLLTHRLSTPQMLVVCAFYPLQARFKAVPVLEALGRGEIKWVKSARGLENNPFQYKSSHSYLTRSILQSVKEERREEAN